MKALIILGDGMSDQPVEKLGGKTPLMKADKPSIDSIARRGRVGLFKTIPDGGSTGSAVANLAVLGYDPMKCFQGRGVLEAASMGIELLKEDVAMRCNLICLDGDKIKNHSSGHISTEEATEIMRDINNELGAGRGDMPLTFHTGISYRHLLVLNGEWGSSGIELTPPHDFVGEKIDDLMPKAMTEAAEPTAKRLSELIEKSREILANHPVNRARRAAGKDTADIIWPWSPGKKPEMQTMQERFEISGAVISAVDLIKGLGVYAGMKVIEVEGATGLEDTNYEGKAQAALDALEDYDFVYLHVEATDEAGHARDLDLKIKCIEYLDSRLVKPILDGLEKRGIQAAIAVLPDHETPVETGKHGRTPVPVAVWRPDLQPDDITAYDEEQAAKGSLGLLEGDAFINLLLGRK